MIKNLKGNFLIILTKTVWMKMGKRGISVIGCFFKISLNNRLSSKQIIMCNIQSNDKHKSPTNVIESHSKEEIIMELNSITQL